MTLPPSPTSVIIGNLMTGSAYSIRAAAWTLAGLGPATDATTFTMEMLSFQQHHPQQPQPTSLDDLADVETDSNDLFGKAGRGRGGGGVTTQVVQETWFILAIGGVLLATLILLIGALVLRRRWVRNKAMSSVHKVELSDGSVGGCSDELVRHTIRSAGHGTRDLLWSRGWQSGHAHRHGTSATTTSQKEAELEASKALLPHGAPPPEYAELMVQHGGSHPADQAHLSLSSFLPRRSSNSNSNGSSGNGNSMVTQTPPSAYATTTLVNPSASRHGPSPYSSKSSADSSSSGSYALDLQHQLQQDRNSRKNGSINGFPAHQQRIPNWADLLPPPPRHPPPPSPAPNHDRDVRAHSHFIIFPF